MSAQVQISTGYFITLEMLLNAAPEGIARYVGLDIDTFLAEVERWAEINLPYGVRVDREAGTISQAGAA